MAPSNTEKTISFATYLWHIKYENHKILKWASDMGKNKDIVSGKGGLDLVRVRRAGQITLPREVRDAMNLDEGDYLEPQFTKGGVLFGP